MTKLELAKEILVALVARANPEELEDRPEKVGLIAIELAEYLMQNIEE